MSSRPSFDLELIKTLVRLEEWTATTRAFQDASEMEFDPSDIRDCVLSLTAADFYKTAGSETLKGRMQDVYKPTYCEIRIYLKLQIHEEKSISRKKTVVISFHQCD